MVVTSEALWDFYTPDILPVAQWQCESTEDIMHKKTK